jgi:hypothetical protein
MWGRGLRFSLCCAAVLTLPGAAGVAPLPAASRHRSATPSADAGRGIAWETSLAAAQAKARRTGKPLFLLHLFGKLSEPFC